MKVEIINRATGSVYRKFSHAVRIATRLSTTVFGIVEYVVYSGGGGYAFNSDIYDIVVTKE